VKAAIAYDGGGGDWSEADVQGVMANVREVQRSLRRLGFSTTLVPVRLHDLKWLGRLQRVDVVFNLIEGINGMARFEDWAVGALELTGVPFTGCRATAVSLCHRKHIANTLLARAGVPVPSFGLGHRNVVPEGLRLPVIVKPSGEDASVGIDGGAICTTRAAVRERLALMSEQFDAVVVQEYIEGREFNVGFLGSEVLPLSEISFERLPAGYWPIVSYAAKWAEGTPEYIGTDPVCPARVDPALADRIITAARRAWEVLGGGEGYGRVDLRVAPDGTPYVLEVNPNPDLSSDAGFARMGAALGWNYDALIGQVVEETLHRARRGAAADSLVRSVTG
jgi:D-alanine-D-alanine ligase